MAGHKKKSKTVSLRQKRRSYDVAYRTKLGRMLIGKIEDALDSHATSSLRGKVNLIFTSPPFPLVRKKRSRKLKKPTLSPMIHYISPDISVEQCPLSVAALRWLIVSNLHHIDRIENCSWSAQPEFYYTGIARLLEAGAGLFLQLSRRRSTIVHSIPPTRFRLARKR